MAKSGTTTATGNSMRTASKSGISHGPAHKNVQNHGKSKGVLGSGASRSTTSPLKGPDRGGLK